MSSTTRAVLPPTWSDPQAAGWRCDVSSPRDRIGDAERRAVGQLIGGSVFPDDLGRDDPVVLARTSPRALTGDYRPALEDLTAPYAPGLAPLDGAEQARPTRRAALAQRLCPLEFSGRLGEPQVRVLNLARQISRCPARDRIEVIGCEVRRYQRR